MTIYFRSQHPRARSPWRWRACTAWHGRPCSPWSWRARTAWRGRPRTSWRWRARTAWRRLQERGDDPRHPKLRIWVLMTRGTLISSVLWIKNALWIKTERKAFIPRPASRRWRRHRELLYLPQREDDPRHPESASAMTRKTLICAVKLQFAFYSRCCE